MMPLHCCVKKISSLFVTKDETIASLCKHLIECNNVIWNDCACLCFLHWWVFVLSWMECKYVMLYYRLSTKKVPRQMHNIIRSWSRFLIYAAIEFYDDYYSTSKACKQTYYSKDNSNNRSYYRFLYHLFNLLFILRNIRILRIFATASLISLWQDKVIEFLFIELI